MNDAFAIVPLPDPLPHAMAQQIDGIFFTSSLRTTFADDAERTAFRQRWLGRYLETEADNAFVALSADGEVIGYIVGALQDPAGNPRYADIDYFAALADVTPSYPAHLHINVHADWRNCGVGARLIQAFCDRAAGEGVVGVHLVTGATSRNLTFYARNGFHPIREHAWNGTQVVMLGRRLLRPTG